MSPVNDRLKGRQGRRPRFSALSSIFGKGVKFAVRDDVVSTEIIGVASEDSRRVAAVLNGAVYLSGVHFTVDGRDTHYFIKAGPLEADLGVVGGGTSAQGGVSSSPVSAAGLGSVQGGVRVLENGVNVSVSQMSAQVAGRQRRFADIQLRHAVLGFNVRYGATPDEERERLLEAARVRAVQAAWLREQRRVQEGDGGSRAWTEAERKELLAEGKVAGYEGVYALPVEDHPELADSPHNIHFLRHTGTDTGHR